MSGTERHPAERADTGELIRGRARVGDFEITVLTDGHFFLDGGAMFGMVPKPLWEKRAPADAEPAVAAPGTGLLNGPQLPSNAMDQSDIDKLLASFE